MKVLPRLVFMIYIVTFFYCITGLASMVSGMQYHDFLYYNYTASITFVSIGYWYIMKRYHDNAIASFLSTLLIWVNGSLCLWVLYQVHLYNSLSTGMAEYIMHSTMLYSMLSILILGYVVVTKSQPIEEED